MGIYTNNTNSTSPITYNNKTDLLSTPNTIENCKLIESNMSTKEDFIDEREEGEIIDEFEDIISSDEEFSMRKRIEELEAKNAELEKIANISVSAAYASGGYNDYPKKDSHHLDRYAPISIDISDDEEYPPAPKMQRISKRRKSTQHSSSSRYKLLHTSSTNHRRRKRSSSPPPAPSYRQSDKLLLSLFHERVAAHNSHSSKRKRKTKKTHSNKSSRRKSREHYFSESDDEYNNFESYNLGVHDHHHENLNNSDCDRSYSINRDELRLALARNTHRIERHVSLKDRLTRKKENTDMCNFMPSVVEDSSSQKPVASNQEEQKVEETISLIDDKEDSDDDLEEQELRILALKSAVLKKHMVRKKRNENAAYSPSDFDEIYKCISESPSLNNIDEQETCNSMEISPVPSPKMILSDDGGIDTKPVDMDIVNSDSESECELPSCDKWIPIEQIPLPNNLTSNEELFNPTPMRYDFTTNNNFNNNSDLGHLMPPEVQYESTSISPKNFDSEVDEEELALRALLLSKMNSPKVNKTVKKDPPKEVKVQTPDLDVSLEAEALRDFLINNMKKKAKPKNSSASVLKEAVRRLTNKNTSQNSVDSKCPVRSENDTENELSLAIQGMANVNIGAQPTLQSIKVSPNQGAIRVRNIETLRAPQKTADEQRICDEERLMIPKVEEDDSAQLKPMISTPKTIPKNECVKTVSSQSNKPPINDLKHFRRKVKVKIERMKLPTFNIKRETGSKQVDAIPPSQDLTSNVIDEDSNASKDLKICSEIEQETENVEQTTNKESNSSKEGVVKVDENQVDEKAIREVADDVNLEANLKENSTLNQQETVVVREESTIIPNSISAPESSEKKNTILQPIQEDNYGKALSSAPKKIPTNSKDAILNKLKNKEELDGQKHIKSDEMKNSVSSASIDIVKKAVVVKKTESTTPKVTTTIETSKKIQSAPIRQVKLSQTSIQVQIQQKKIVNTESQVPLATKLTNTHKPTATVQKSQHTVINNTLLHAQKKMLPSPPNKMVKINLPNQQTITTRTKIVKPNKVINQQTIDLKRKNTDNTPQTSMSTKRPKMDDNNRLITSAEIPKVPELVIQLRASESESEYSELSANELEEDDDSRVRNLFNTSLTTSNDYYDIASPISLPMESPCDTPTQSGSPVASRTQTPQPTVEKLIVNDLFEANLERFLKNVRSKVSDSSKKPVEVKAPAVIKTPVAVRLLTEEAQQEYRDLINRMKMLERQKQAKNHVKTNDSGPSDSRTAITDGDNKFLCRKVLVKNATSSVTEKPKSVAVVEKSATAPAKAQKSQTKPISPLAKDDKEIKSSKENLLVLYENSYRKTGASIINNLEKSIEMVVVMKKAKMEKLKYEQRLRELQKEMANVQKNLEQQQEKITKIYPEICNSHRAIESLKTRRLKINKAITTLGKSVIGPNYSMQNDQKSEITEKSKQLAAEIKFVNTMKLSDIDLVEGSIPVDTKKLVAPVQSVQSIINEKVPTENPAAVHSEKVETSLEIYEKLPTKVVPSEKAETSLEKQTTAKSLEDNQPSQNNDTPLPTPQESPSTVITENEGSACGSQSPENLNVKTVPEDTANDVNNTIVPETFSNKEDDHDEKASSTSTPANGHEEALELQQPVIVDDDNNINNEQSPKQTNMDENVQEENGGEQVGSAILQDYVSPLGHLRDERHINPNGVVCPYQLMGQCDDKDCRYMHLED